MKRVLLTLNNNRLSGIEKFTVLLAKHLDKNRYNVEIGVPTYGPLCEMLEKDNIDYFIFNNKVNGKHTLSGIVSLFKKINKEKYDIIHAQAGIPPCLIGKILGTNLIIEHKHGLDFTTEQISSMNMVKLCYERLKKYFVNKTLTGCESDRKTLISKFNYKKENVTVIYNGIEGEAEFIEKRINKKFTVGTIGRLTFQKGQEYLIEAANILVNKGYDFEFHIYGEGEMKNEYLSLIRSFDLEKNVLLKGYTENITQTMNTFDLFVLPSRYEGIPYVILEAMKASVPVISTDVGGIKEVITDMSNGILVVKENPEELAKKILLLHDSKELRIQISDKARNDFIEKYTISKTIDAIESVYSD